MAASKALRKAEKSKEQRLKKERKAKAQAVVAKGKDKRERQEAYKKAEDAAQKKREERKAKKEAERKRVVTSSKVQHKIKKKRKDEMDKWSEEFGAVADKHVEERKRKAAAQETVDASKRLRKGQGVMEKVQEERAFAEKDKQDEAAATSLRKKAAEADVKLEQQFKDQADEYKGVRKEEKKRKVNDNREAAANKEVWGKEQSKKYYTKDESGNFKPSAEAMKDDPNAEKKPLSHWIEKEDTDDGGEWKGVTKNPIQFFLKNPEKLKNLSTNNRKTMLKKMSKYINEPQVSKDARRALKKVKEKSGAAAGAASGAVKRLGEDLKTLVPGGM